ncbi:MAG: T9SS type A sorting domain-containing protein [Bacteroidota bacterium]
MKNLLVLCFLISSLPFSFSQDWSLFPQGQETFWRIGDELELYFNDYTKIDTAKNTHYFGALYLTEDSVFQCYKDIVYGHFELDGPPVDSLFSTDEYWFGFLGNDEIRFQHLANKNDLWTVVTPESADIDSIVFNCTDLTEEEIFGINDSVKIFSVNGYFNGNKIAAIDDLEFKLSRSFGMLQFIPFNQLGEQINDHQLIGFDDGQPHGFTSSWEDFFGKFEVEQIMMWQYRREYIYTPSGYWKAWDAIRDSITSVEFTDTYVKLGIFRKGRSALWEHGNQDYFGYDTIVYYQEIDTIYYFRDHFETVFDAPPGWLKFNHQTKGVAFHEEAMIADWGQPFYVFNDIYSYYDTTDCGFLTGHPGPIPSTLSAGLGPTHWGAVGGQYGEYYEWELSGYKIGDEEFGNVYDIVNSVFDRPVLNLFFNVFPNPATDNLNIELLENNYLNNLELKIIDATGKVFLSKELNNNLAKINISDIPKGIYFVVVNGEKKLGRKKFVKY